MELGRLDGRSFSKSIVKHVLPGPGFDLNQLNALFASNGLTQFDMIALSGTVHFLITSVSAMNIVGAEVTVACPYR